MFDGLTRGLARRLSRRLTRLASRMLVRPPIKVGRVARKTAQPPPPAVLTTYARHAAGEVREVTAFGANPGRLRMLLQLPPTPPLPGAPLLVLLHGCGQDPVRFAAASGFSALAARLRAPLLLPLQSPQNNVQGCFNWFHPADTARGSGEVASIRHMVASALRRYAGDQRRVFIAGLSAGGALTAALLAAYPELFAGGAVIAGLPVGAANNLAGAISRMHYAPAEPRAAWVARVPPRRTGARPPRRWPKLSIWHGESDRTVHPANGAALAAQWTGLLGLPEAPDQDQHPAPMLRRRAWGNSVEHWSIAGFGHAFPIARSGGTSDPYVATAGIAAVEHIARFWGLDAG